MKLRLPLNGVSDVLADSEQPSGTTRDMLNMRGEDRANKKRRLSQRPGVVKYLDDLVTGVSDPIRALRALTFPRKNIVYTDKTSSAASPLDSASIPFSVLTGSAMPVTNADTDKQGNVYAVDGLAGIAKYNSTFELQWKQPLPVRQETAAVRALRVASMPLPDADSEVLFAGVSAGGRQVDALMWAYKQISTRDEEGKVETKTELLWEFEPEAYTEVIRIRNSLLYAAQNEPDKGRAYVRVYFNLISGSPTLAKEFEVPYPIYGLDVRAEDGAIITCHPPNTTRGADPRGPSFTARNLAREWTPDDLTERDKRLWLDLNAQSLKDAGFEDGDSVSAWVDDGPAFRAHSQGTAIEQPVYIENGPGGEPTIRFNGIDTKSLGLKPNLESETNPSVAPQFDDQQKTALPAYFGSRWAMFLVVRLPMEAAVRPIFFQDNSAANTDTETDQLLANKTTLGAGGANSVPFSGKVTWYTQTDMALGAGTGVGTTDGGALHHMPFSADHSYAGSTGTSIITIVCDGHFNSATDSAQHSVIRMNGRPIDRWVSVKQSGFGPSLIGAGSIAAWLQGDVSRMIVLRDYAAGGAHGDPATGNVATNGTAHYPHAIGAYLSAPAATAYGSTTGNRYNDNEIERIEGYLAGQYGISHVLPFGTASVLAATANYAAGETVVLGPTTYTFVAALTGAAGEVLIAANTKLSTINLMRAINNNGAPGTDYDAEVAEHTTARATCVNDQDVNTAKLKIETRGLTTVACTETCANASWSNNPTSTVATTTTSAILYMPGHYPHPFALPYGFPRKDVGAAVGVTLESKGLLLNSHEGILARWDPQGKIVWVATSRLALAQLGGFNLPASDQKFGAIGYDCAFGADEDVDVIYSAGPQYSASPGDEGSALRRIIDTPSGPTMTGSGTWTMGMTALIGATVEYSMTDTHMRIAVDTLDNVYLPIYEPTAANNSVMTAVCVSTVPVAGVPTATVAWTWRVANAATNPAGICIAVDKKLPVYDGDPATRAFGVYIGTRMGYTTDLLTQANLYRLEPVTVRHLEDVATSQTRLCAVVNGELWTSLAGGAFTEPAGEDTLPNPVLSTDTLNPDGYYSMATLNGHLFITDGRAYVDYDGRKDKLLTMRSKTAGELSARARCVMTWRARLVWYRFADSPHEYLMSAVGAPYDYDIAPPVQSKTQAVLGSRSPQGTGQAPDIMNKLFAGSDDTLFFGCANSIHRLDGDPMDNGRFVLVTDETGIAFGESVCKDENGVIYAFGTRGSVVRIIGANAVVMSDAIPERLRSIDFSATRPLLVWSHIDEGLHLFLSPVNPLDAAITEHYFWSRKSKGWYPDSINSTNMQPTCTFVGDGELASDRRVIFGCPDGYIRAFDSAATDDDGVAILSRCLVGPLAPDDLPNETDFKGLRGTLASAQGSCAYRMFASDTPDELGNPVASGTLNPGVNGIHWAARGVGSYVAIEVSNSTTDSFAVESLDFVDVSAAGQKVKR